MNRTCPSGRCTVAGLALLFAAAGANAQSAGTVMLRIGATEIKPDVSSGDLSPPSLAGSQVGVKSDTQLSGGITWMLTDNVSIDLPLSLPFVHEIDGAGAISGVGKIGEVHALPLTLLGQYRFLASNDVVRPYLGAGLTYAEFYKARSTAALSALTGGTPSSPTTLSIASKFAATVQGGLTYAFSRHWGLDLSVAHTFLKTRAQLSTGQTLDLSVDPNSYSLSVVYAF